MTDLDRRRTTPGALVRRLAVAAIALAIGLFAGLAPDQAAANGICSAANVNALLDTGQRQNKVDKRLFYSDAKRHFPVYDEFGQHYAGTDAIIDYWNDHPELKDPRWLAYILATAYHETAFVMFPVRETLADSDEEAVSRLARSRCCSEKTYWRKHPETGEHYFGRGYVQLTWDFNYQRADERFGITERTDSYYWNPEFALDPERSIRITYDGMVYGWYTGRCLLQYIQPDRREDFRNARRIINGLDRANDIALQASQFLESIKAAEVPATFEESQAAEKSGAIGEELDGLQEQDAAFAKSIADLEQRMSDRVDLLQAAIERERVRFETMTAANERMSQDMQASRAELTAARSEIEAARGDLDETRAEIDAARVEIDEARADIAATRGDIENARRELEDARADIEALRVGMSDVSRELRAAPSRLELSETDKERITAVETAIDTLSSDQRLNRDALIALERQIEAVGIDVDAQTQRLATLVEELRKSNDRTVWSYIFGGE